MRVVMRMQRVSESPNDNESSIETAGSLRFNPPPSYPNTSTSSMRLYAAPKLGEESGVNTVNLKILEDSDMIFYQ